LEVIREETTENTTTSTLIRFEDAVVKACKINPDVREYLGRLYQKSHVIGVQILDYS